MDLESASTKALRAATAAAASSFEGPESVDRPASPWDGTATCQSCKKKYAHALTKHRERGRLGLKTWEELTATRTSPALVLCVRKMILSSISVTFSTNVTSYLQPAERLETAAARELAVSAQN